MVLAIILLAAISATVQASDTEITVTADSIAEQGGKSTVIVKYKYASTTGYFTYSLDGSTATHGTDFVESTFHVLEDLSGRLEITAVDDGIYDPGEVVRVSFTYTATLFGVPVITLEMGSVVITIDDNEPPPSVSLSSSSTTVSESGNSVSLKAGLSSASPLEVSVSYATANGSAVAGSDYESASGTLVFSAGETEKSLQVMISEDKLDEADETFEVRLSSPSNATLGSPSKATVSITDNDKQPAVSLSSSSLSVSEDTASVTATARLDAASGQDVTVNYETTDGSASAPSDYTAASGTLTFAAGQTSKVISVSIADDTVDEPNETFSVSLSSPSNASLGTPSTTTVTITDDDDAPTVTLSLLPTKIEEGDSATVRARLSHASSEDTTVTVTAPGVTVTGNPLTISAGSKSSSGRVRLESAENDEDEPDRTVTVSGKATNAQGVAGDPASGILTIKDDDEPPPPPPPVSDVSLSSSTLSVGEAGGSVTVTARLSSASSSVVTVKYATANISARAGSDYKATSGTLRFAAGDTRKSFDVPITQDTVDEPAETFRVSLSAPSNATLGSRSRTTVTITDDDKAPTVTLSLSPTKIEEGGSATVRASLTHASSAATTVTISAPGVTVSGNPLTISAGSKSSSGRVTLKSAENDEDEPDRTVTVSGKASNPQGIAGDPASVTLTIEDDDEPPLPDVSLSSSTLSVGEGAGSVTVIARLSAASSSAVTVKYATADVSARAGSDYTATSGTLSFAAGDTRASFDVPITADEADEPDETFTVSISAPANATLGSLTRTTVTITDDDDAPTVSLSLSASSIEEGGSATVRATLSHPSSAPTTVTVSAPGVTVTGSPLTIPAGDKSSGARVTLASADNSTDEPDRTVTVSGKATNARGVAGDPASVTLRITDDDDPPTVTLSLSASKIDEGDSATVTASLSHPSSEATTVTVSAPGVIVTGNPLRIPAGDQSSSARVTLKAPQNDDDEPDQVVTVSGKATNARGVAGDPASVTLRIRRRIRRR